MVISPEMMKENLKKQYHFLRILAHSHPSQKRALLKTANNDQILSLCEICLNILNGNIPVNASKLKKYKNLLRSLSKKRESIQKKKRLLVNQSGGFLPLIAPAIISALGGILGPIISKRL